MCVRGEFSDRCRRDEVLLEAAVYEEKGSLLWRGPPVERGDEQPGQDPQKEAREDQHAKLQPEGPKDLPHQHAHGSGRRQ
ncbi:hypothetical protein MTO96_021586 [Rhipicephalus appendiculatus]